jgi:cytochrome c biogenesis protein CcdA
MTYFVLALYAIGMAVGFWNAWFCGKQAEKNLERVKRWEHNLTEAEYWAGRVDWWITQGYINLAVAVVMFACGAVFAAVAL